MDPRSLTLVLRGALRPVPEERRAAEEALAEECAVRIMVGFLGLVQDRARTPVFPHGSLLLNAMDPRSLTLVLRGALSPVPEERRAAEEALAEFQYTPQHLVTFLQIIVDDTYDMAVRYVGSIHLKNFVAKNWLPFKPGEPQKISERDKSIVRKKILGVVVKVPQLLRTQCCKYGDR